MMTHHTRLNWLNCPATCEPKYACMVWNTSDTGTPSNSALLRLRSTKSCCEVERKVLLTPCSSGRWRAREERLQLFLCCRNVASGTILQVELETAGGAHAGNRRRVDSEDETVAQFGVGGVEPRKCGEGEQRGILALFEGLQ